MLKRIQLECMGREPSEVDELSIDNCRSAGEPEGLTDEFTSLTKLSMVNAGLTTLKGFPKLAALQKLELSDNRISGTLSCLNGCSSLKTLNLSGNKIENTESLEPLSDLTNLSQLDLTNCEVTKVSGYREAVFKLLPNLKYLDGFDRDDQEAVDSDEENEVPENGHKESNGANGDDEDVDDEQVVDGEEQATEAVDDEGSAGESDEGEEEVDDGEDDDEEEDDEEEEEYGLSYLEGDDIQDDEDDDDYQEGEEQEDDDIDEEDEDACGDTTARGIKRKHEDEEEA